MDEVIFEAKILDHGYIRFIESWGSDQRIIESARMSTDKGFQGWGKDPDWICPTCMYSCADELISEGVTRVVCPNNCGDLVFTEYPKGDEKLLKYLYEHKHATPFEFAGFVIEVQAPIFVFREWHRHRTQSYNEMSARYVPLPNMNYMPTPGRCAGGLIAGSNKQAQGITNPTIPLTRENIDTWLHNLQDAYDYAEMVYQQGLSAGIPKEIARLPVPVARYSRMRACANLRNWLAFLTLRRDPAAQWEIRQYAEVVGNIVERLFPRTWELFIS